MNELQKAYLDGAAMAYRDVAAKLRNMIKEAPPSFKSFMAAMEPFAITCELKAKEVYKEAERIKGVRQ